MLAPVLALIVVIGVYPKPFLERIQPSADKVVDVLNKTSVDSGGGSDRGVRGMNTPVVKLVGVAPELALVITAFVVLIVGAVFSDRVIGPISPTSRRRASLSRSCSRWRPGTGSATRAPSSTSAG